MTSRHSSHGSAGTRRRPRQIRRSDRWRPHHAGHRPYPSSSCVVSSVLGHGARHRRRRYRRCRRVPTREPQRSRQRVVLGGRDVTSLGHRPAEPRVRARRRRSGRRRAPRVLLGATIDGARSVLQPRRLVRAPAPIAIKACGCSARSSRQDGYHFTDLSPSGNVVALNRRLGFTQLDTATALVPNLPWPPAAEACD